MDLLKLLYGQGARQNTIIKCRETLREMVTYKSLNKVPNTNLRSYTSPTHQNQDWNLIDDWEEHNITCLWCLINVDTVKLSNELE